MGPYLLPQSLDFFERKVHLGQASLQMGEPQAGLGLGQLVIRPAAGKHGRGVTGKAKVVVAVETPADKPRFEASWMFLPVFVMSGWYPVVGKKRRRSCPGSMP